jgi:hypothetical protein
MGAGGSLRPLAIYVAPLALSWPVNRPLTGLRVLFPGRPDWLLLLLFPLSPGLPRMEFPVVILLLVVPVLRSVRRLMCFPMFPLSVLPHRAAAPLLVILRDALFAPLCLYPPCGSWAFVVRATCVSDARVARRPLPSLPGCGGAGSASVVVGGRRAAPTAVGLEEVAGASRRTVVDVVAASGYSATTSGATAATVGAPGSGDAAACGDAAAATSWRLAFAPGNGRHMAATTGVGVGGVA